MGCFHHFTGWTPEHARWAAIGSLLVELEIEDFPRARRPSAVVKSRFVSMAPSSQAPLLPRISDRPTRTTRIQAPHSSARILAGQYRRLPTRNSEGPKVGRLANIPPAQPLMNFSAPPHPSRPALGHGKGDGFPVGYRFAELAAFALRVHRKRAAPALRVNTLPTASACGWRPLRVLHTGRWPLVQQQRGSCSISSHGIQRLASGLVRMVA